MKKRIFVVIIAVLYMLMLSACGQSDPVEEEPNGPTWQEQYDLGVRYLSEGNYKEAILAFTAAIEIDPKQAPAYVGRGDAYIGSGETEENLAAALADYEKAVELDETNAEVYLGMADVYIRQGDYDKALEILQQGLEKTDANQEIANKISELNSNDGSGEERIEAGPNESQVAVLLREGDSGNLLTLDEFSFYGNDYHSLSIDAAEEILQQNNLYTGRNDHGDEIHIIGAMQAIKDDGFGPLPDGPYIVVSQSNDSTYIDGCFYADAWREEDRALLDTGIRGICIGDSLETVLGKLGFTTAGEIAEIANTFFTQEFEERDDLKKGIEGWRYPIRHSDIPDTYDIQNRMRIEFHEPLIEGGSFLDNGHLKVNGVSFFLYLGQNDEVFIDFDFEMDRLVFLSISF